MPPDERNDEEDASRTGSDGSETQDTIDTPEPETDSELETDSAPETTPATRAISRRRLIGVDVLIGVTTVLLIVAMFAVWANRLLFNPDNWSNTSTQLLQDPNIRSATINSTVVTPMSTSTPMSRRREMALVAGAVSDE